MVDFILGLQNVRSGDQSRARHTTRICKEQAGLSLCSTVTVFVVWKAISLDMLLFLLRNLKSFS